MTTNASWMLAQTKEALRTLLEIPYVATVRRNHAIEHATVHVLTWRGRYRILAGRASPAGFYIYGAVDPQELESAAREAISRLRSGEKYLAVHPRCGTNLAVTAILAGLVSLWATSGRGSLWVKIPRLLLFITLAVIAAQPLGPLAQEQITTLAEVGDAQIQGVISRPPLPGGMPVHQVLIS